MARLSTRERRELAERAYGSPRVPATTIARELGVSPGTVHAELRRAHCRNCGRVLCACSDLHYAGLAPPAEMGRAHEFDLGAGVAEPAHAVSINHASQHFQRNHCPEMSRVKSGQFSTR